MTEELRKNLQILIVLFIINVCFGKHAIELELRFVLNIIFFKYFDHDKIHT